MPTSAQQSILTIEQFIEQVGGQTKVADGSTPLSEPGSIGGETTHPVKKVDDRLETPKEGERFKENTKDVNEDQGKTSVQAAGEAKAGTDKAASIFDLVSAQAAGNGRQKTAEKACVQCKATPCTCKTAAQKRAEGGAVSQGGSAESDQMQIGTKVAPTGEDAKSETGKAKAGKEDPGSTHPARTDNDKIDGHKWSVDADAPLEKLASVMRDVGNNLCAQIQLVSQDQAPKTAAAAQAAGNGQTPAPVQKQAGEIDPWLAQQAGWEMAALIAGQFDKQAADSLVLNTLTETVKTACVAADRFISFMEHYKRAAEEPLPPDMAGGGAPPPPGGGDPSMGGGAPPPGGGGGGGEAAMMAALGGGAGAPGGGAPPPPGGGDPSMGGGGGGEQEAIIAQIEQLMQQGHITPEELEAALQAEAGGGGMGGEGGGDPAGGPGGAPPPPPPAAGGAGGMEAAAGDRGGQQKQGQINKSAVHQYITELIGRSRRRAG